MGPEDRHGILPWQPGKLSGGAVHLYFVACERDETALAFGRIVLDLSSLSMGSGRLLFNYNDVTMQVQRNGTFDHGWIIAVCEPIKRFQHLFPVPLTAPYIGTIHATEWLTIANGRISLLADCLTTE